MPERVASTPMPSRHRSTRSINASLGNPDRRPSFARDAGQARADGHQARSLALTKHPMQGNHGVPATPDHLSFPSARARQAVLRYARRRFEALELLVPRSDVPKIVDWYMNGKIDIDNLITRVMLLKDIDRAFDLMHSGESIRSVVMFQVSAD